MPPIFSQRRLARARCAEIAVINHRWRMIDDPFQWILQVRKGRETSKSTGWLLRRGGLCHRRLLWLVYVVTPLRHSRRSGNDLHT